MKLAYDEKVDALFISFSDQQIVNTEEVRPGLILDLDEDGRIVQIEMLDVKQQLAPQALASLQAAE
jgi:uncharacterized protein YuzE